VALPYQAGATDVAVCDTEISRIGKNSFDIPGTPVELIVSEHGVNSGHSIRAIRERVLAAHE